MPTLWLPPKVWFQGSQSTSTGGSSARKAKHWRSICWLAQIMRWVLITPLGCLVEPEVNRNLAMVSGPTWPCASISSGPISVASIASKRLRLRPCSAGVSSPLVTQTSTSGGTTLAMALRNAWPSAANTSPGVSVPRICFSLAKSCDTVE